jgi:outer membrane protein TolC
MRSNGLATIVALAQSRRETAQARYDLAAAEGAERTAYAELIFALGLSAGTRLSVEDSSALAMPLPPVQNVAQAVQQALMRRPDVIAALSRIDAANGALKSEQASYYPTIALSAQVFQNIGALSSDGSAYSSVNKTGVAALLTLSLPLFDGGARHSRVAIARSQVKEAEDKLQELHDQTTRDVVSAYDKLQTSLAQHEAALALKDAAHTAYEAALRAYKQGLGTYTEVATEENAAVQADTAVEDAHANAHTAAAALAFAMGAADGTVPPVSP